MERVSIKFRIFQANRARSSKQDLFCLSFLSRMHALRTDLINIPWCEAYLSTRLVSLEPSLTKTAGSFLNPFEGWRNEASFAKAGLLWSCRWFYFINDPAPSEWPSSAISCANCRLFVMAILWIIGLYSWNRCFVFFGHTGHVFFSGAINKKNRHIIDT